MTKTKYWYKITIHACPLCGREKVYRERQYTPKPKDDSERYAYSEHFDWCEW